MNEIIDYNEQDELPILENISAWPICQKYAIYNVGISILYGLLPLVIDGLQNNKLFQYAGMIPLIALFYLCFKEHKTEELKGYLPFKRILRISLYMGLIAAPIMAIWTFVLYQYIAPGLLDEILEITRKALEEKMVDNPDQVESIMTIYTKWLFKPIMMAIFSLIFSIPMHLFVGCITGLFQRKELK